VELGIGREEGGPHPRAGTVAASVDGIVPAVRSLWQRIRIDPLVPSV